MASVYLSPSTKDYNRFYNNSNSESYYTGIIADFMEPLLQAASIAFVRKKPKMTAGTSAAHSNETRHNLHLTIHTAVAGIGNEGSLRGVNIYYYQPSAEGKKAAEVFCRNLKTLYPRPGTVNIIPNTSFVELNKTKAPALIIEAGYRDNPDDCEWIKNNLQAIACNLTLSVTEYFDEEGRLTRKVIPELYNITGNENNITENTAKANEKAHLLNIQQSSIPRTTAQSGIKNEEVIQEVKKAYANTKGKRLNLRCKPSLNSRILGQIPDKSFLEVLSLDKGWYTVRYNGLLGYVLSDYLSIK